MLRRAGWLFFFLSAFSAHAWGPHPKITQAALDSLGTNHALFVHLGAQAQRLTNYCWMADYKRLPFREPEEDFYANDYLLFPEVTTHIDHICPEVKKTYRPYFKRALQAMRTETQANAARWIGSLLHFVEDTGSPPHAAEIRGPSHINMENWVDANLIELGGYQPQLFGTTEEEALAGFLRRMDDLIVFSKERARRVRIHVEIGNRTAVRPVVLESALETSRVTADLLHTLATIVPRATNSAATLRGKVSSKALPVGLERFPAKVVLEGTGYSTLADLSGNYEFRNLPPDNYKVLAFRAGCGAGQAPATLTRNEVHRCDLILPNSKPTENLLRNGDFKVKWIQADAPDGWYRAKSEWEGEIVPLKKGQRYRLHAKFKENTTGSILVRWTRDMPYVIPKPGFMPKIEAKPLTPENSELVFTGSEQMAFVQLTLLTAGAPEGLCEDITLLPVMGEGE